MRQRVSVARTLAMNPKVLLLDEPLSALDALTRANLQDEISQLWERDKKTVILITNDPDEALLLADRVIPLSRGPRATLLPSIPVTLPRPRDRRGLNQNAEFKRIRNQVVESLVNLASEPLKAERPVLELPKLEPADISRPRSFFDRTKGSRTDATKPAVEAATP
jgi:nitrate/nitrite transport system ATP-binding protein